MEVLECLQKYGQRLDVEIAKETGLSVATVRTHLDRLTASGEVVTCNLIRFDKGSRLDALQCRVAGYIPPRAPGRKPTAIK